MTSLVTSSSPVYYTAQQVVNTDTTITGISGRMVMFKGLTAPRTFTLPPATTDTQTIMFIDEDGSCNLTNYITITCAGTDKIEGNPTRILNYPYAAIAITSTGLGSWVVTTNPNPSLSAGIQIPPTYTDNGDGSITFTSGLYCFFTNTSGIGKIKRFNIAGTTFVLTDNTNQYIVADYNAGSPTIYVTTDVTIINETTIIPVYTIYRRGTVLHILEWDALGDALGNKTHQSIVKTQRFRTEPGGLMVGEAATRLVTITGGTVWHGAVKNVMSAFNSSVNTLWQAYHVAGVWTFSTTTQYNNTQYDDGTNLQTLPGGKYAVNFVYRVIGSNETDAIFVLGGGAYSLGDAQASQPPANLPAELVSHCTLVGRIIVSQGASTATQIDSAFTIAFSPAGVTDHNSLLNLQGGTASQYYHLTSAEYTGTGTGNFARADSPTFTTTISTPRVTFSTSSMALMPTGFTDSIAFRDTTANTASRLYVVPNGAPTGTTAAFKIFATDYIADNINYQDCGFYHDKVTGEFRINTKSNGALSTAPITFTSMDGARFSDSFWDGVDGGAVTFFGHSIGGRKPSVTLFNSVPTYFVSDAAFLNNKLLRFYNAAGTAAGNGVRLNASDQLEILTNSSVAIRVTTVGDTSVLSATASSSTTTGALIVTGGIGCGGAIHAGSAIFAPNAVMDAAAGSAKGIYFRSGGVNRWYLSSSGAAETGSDAGSPFTIDAYSDTGIAIDTVFSFIRASGGDLIFGGSTNRTSKFNGNNYIVTVGKTLGIKEGTNAKMGSVTLTAGAVIVSTTAVASNSRIFLTSQVDGGTPGFLRVSTRTAGTSFTITSSSATDTSTVAWVILDPL